EAITSENEALSCKDAVFNAFFDISKINKLCDAHGLNFIHHLHILPGAKTVRIIGALKKSSAYQRVTIIGGPKVKDQDPRMTPEMELSKDDLKSNIKVLDAEISALERQVTDSYQERNTNNFGEKIKEEKKKW
ncbi:hypothetical protein K501DRAFT_155343, partial [Backusella circina FSU 941]